MVAQVFEEVIRPKRVCYGVDLNILTEKLSHVGNALLDSVVLCKVNQRE